MDAAFEEWARARTPALLRAGYLLTGHQHSAEDLTQATLERVAGAWRRIDDPDAYARQVMYRVQVSWWRRRRVPETITDSVPETGQVDETASADLRVSLAGALRRLTSGQRAILVLRFYEDLSEGEAAAALGCSVGNVKSQTHRALAALRRSAPELAELVGRRLPSDA